MTGVPSTNSAAPCASRSLAELQIWMQGQILASIAGALDPGQIEGEITASAQQSPTQRLGIYAIAYLARLIDCLSDEFATLHKLLGEAAFHDLARLYIANCPPESYTLADLGRRFPEFLAQEAPRQLGPEQGCPPEFAGWLMEIALLERTYAEVFDGPGAEQLTPLSAEQWRESNLNDAAASCFEFDPSLRLLRLNYPVHDVISQLRDQSAADFHLPAPRPVWLAVSRRDYIVRRHELQAVEWHLLGLLQQGLPLGNALEQLADRYPPEETHWPAQLSAWFSTWGQRGWIIGLQPNSETRFTA